MPGALSKSRFLIENEMQFQYQQDTVSRGRRSTHAVTVGCDLHHTGKEGNFLVGGQVMQFLRPRPAWFGFSSRLGQRQVVMIGYM